MILYTSDTKEMQPSLNLRRGLIIYLCISIFCLVVFLIYDRFSHNVRSPFMTFLFLWPLLLGVFPALWLFLDHALPKPDRLTLNLYNSSVAALTVSSMMRGVFEIAGTSSVFQTGLMIFGAALWFAGILCYIIRYRRDHNHIRSLSRDLVQDSDQL